MSPAARPPLAAALALGAWLAALAAPPGGPAALLLLLVVSFVPVSLRLFARRLETARTPWAPWLAAAALASLAGGLGGGPGKPLAAVAILVAAGTGASLGGRLAAAVVSALALADLGTALRLDVGIGPTSAHLLALGVAAAAPAVLLERLRSSRDELQDRLAALTGVSAPTAGASAAGPETGRDEPRLELEGPSSEGPELAGLLELTRRALRARSCVLYERLLDPPAWRVAAGASVAPDYDGLATASLGHGLVAWAARHEMPFRISEPGPQLRSVPHYAGDSETGSLLAVPLATDSQGHSRDEESGAWAVLVVDSAHARRFDEEAEDLLALHAAEISERLELARRVARWRDDRSATQQLPGAVAELRSGEGLVPVADSLLEEALALAGASAGAVLWFDARAPGGGAELNEGGRGGLLIAADGLELEAGHRLESEQQSWATWAAANPEQPVALAAFHADRGMPRIARGDGLDSSWSLVAVSLERAGALALAWPERHLPSTAVLEAIRVLAAAGGAALLREEALARLAAGRRLDGLTGLPTRTAFLRRGEELASAAREERLGLLFFDLDRSARLQQEAGPAAWDEAVECTAKALQAALPASAELHRWGGDEFAALLPGAGDEGVTVAAKRACAAAAQVQVAGRALTVSAGTACYRPGREDFAGLLARAAQALGVAREVGGGKVVGAQEPPR